MRLGIVKINFASALDFLLYLQVVKNENLLIWKIMK